MLRSDEICTKEFCESLIWPLFQLSMYATNLWRIPDGYMGLNLCSKHDNLHSYGLTNIIG